MVRLIKYTDYAITSRRKRPKPDGTGEEVLYGLQTKRTTLLGGTTFKIKYYRPGMLKGELENGCKSYVRGAKFYRNFGQDQNKLAAEIKRLDELADIALKKSEDTNHIRRRVEKVLAMKREGAKLLYLLKWEGCPAKDATWQSGKGIKNCPFLARSFRKGYQSFEKTVKGEVNAAEGNAQAPKGKAKGPKRKAKDMSTSSSDDDSNITSVSCQPGTSTQNTNDDAELTNQKRILDKCLPPTDTSSSSDDDVAGTSAGIQPGTNISDATEDAEIQDQNRILDKDKCQPTLDKSSSSSDDGVNITSGSMQTGTRTPDANDDDNNENPSADENCEFDESNVGYEWDSHNDEEDDSDTGALSIDDGTAGASKDISKGSKSDVDKNQEPQKKGETRKTYMTQPSWKMMS